MGRRATGIDRRIMESAERLFYVKGYHTTGLAQIVEEAGTTKASFYQYYSSKEDLAKGYIEGRSRASLRGAIRVMRKSKDPVDFCRRWIELVKREVAQNSSFNGCPLANHLSQLEFSEAGGKEVVRRAARRWIRLLGIYLAAEKGRGNVGSQEPPQTLARKVFAVYQGALITWKFTQQRAVLDEARETMVALLRG